MRQRQNTMRMLSMLCMLALWASFALLAGCAQGRPSADSPIHVNPNMDQQEKYKSQSQSAFFVDGSAMRTPVAGTVARGQLHGDVTYATGKDEKGVFITHGPMKIDMPLLKRGQERYDIFCAPCHSRVGGGRGIMITRNYVPPASFHDDRIRTMPDGQLFDVITNGIRNMPSYSAQIPEADRWAIVAYVRALQRSRNASLNDIPAELQGKLRQ